jgi:V8-like Glu-specific endopeptidase
MTAANAQPLDPADHEGLTAAQLEDLATVVATLGGDKIAWLAKSILGEEAVFDAADDIQDTAVFAAKMVEALRAAERVSDAVALLRRDALPLGRLSMDLEYILRGERLADAAARQAFDDNVEPFLNSADFHQRHPRFLRTVCAVGLGHPHNKIFGTGFLIGPDLVMTNAHVLEPYLDYSNGEVAAKAGVSGDRIFCFFDYHSGRVPRVPHQDGKHAYVTATAKQQGWLYFGRPPLPGEGTQACPPQAGDRFDYAVIVLARRIGALPARSGGGTPRGWLPLPEAVDVLTPQRVIIYQHPGQAPQQLDIGDYVDRDCTNTRVRYTVRTAKGSSGGAAVDSKGDLFALHSAEDKTKAGHNQGVQIDLVAKDLLAKKPELRALPQPDERPFWSLSDNIADPKPIIGRNEFRENVQDVQKNAAAARVLAVWGPQGSGRRFSVKLLERTLGLDVRIASFSADDLTRKAGTDADDSSTSAPVRFLSRLASSLRFYLFQETDIPKPEAAADLPRWLNGELPRWLSGKLEGEAQRDPTRYPAWVVLNTAVEDFKWPFLLPELVAALAGAHDQGKVAVPMPHLRFLFLALKPDSLPSLPGVQRVDEDLTAYTTYAKDFVNCLDGALYAVDRHSNIGDTENWLAAAEVLAGPLDPTERRRVLSDMVRRLVLLRLQGAP